jgi:asparagine synthase (glutamine-hydrolysing)
LSGIAGIIHFDPAPQGQEFIDRLIKSVSHRGPDTIGQWSSGRVALGCCMLRVNPHSQADVQPLIDEKSGAVVVMDGRLENRAELFAQLKPKSGAEETPDAAFVLAAYQRWGQACPRYLLGDFAFAIWDPGQQLLFCARDRLGAGGFSFHCGDRFFAFASESEALLCLPGVSKAPNEECIASMLVPVFQNSSDRRAWHKDIAVLLPGESLTVTPEGKPNIERYWKIEFQDDRQYASYEESEEHFLEVFGAAVRERMTGLGDVAVAMSGGLDSAAVAAMVHRLLPAFPGKHLHSYSAVADDPESCIESRSILSLAHTLETTLHSVSVPSFSGMLCDEDLFAAAWKHAHPVDNSILLPALMCQAASRNGHKLLLHGACGDMAMNSPRYYPAVLLRKGQYFHAWRESVAASANNYFLKRMSPRSIFLRSIAEAAVPISLKNRVRRGRFERRLRNVDMSLLNPDFVKQIRLRERLSDEFLAGQHKTLEEERLFEMQQSLYYICSALSAFSRVAGRFGMEGRDPWSDMRVLDFFFRLPVEYQVRQGWTKSQVRSAFRQELATGVRWRRDKTHLGWLFTKRLMDNSQELIRNTMQQGLVSIEKFVDVKTARAKYASYLQQDNGETRQELFELTTLILWLERIKGL